MIAYGREFRGGKVIDKMVSLIDMPATFLDCAGIDIPSDFQGDSLKKLISGECADWREEVFLQISESQVGRCVRTKDWKYSVRAEADGWKESCSDVYYEDFLYDLKADPYELHNLVSSPAHSDIRLRLSETLKKYMKNAGEDIPDILPCK